MPTMRTVRAILIDPFTCTVTEVEHDADHYQNIYTLISHETHPVDCFTCAYARTLHDGEAIFVDDNGLLNGPLRFFKFVGCEQPLAGKGLILGSDDRGETTGATSALDHIKRSVMFAEHVPGIGLVHTNQPWEKQTA